MEVKNLTELPDGSANVELEMSDEESKILIEAGLKSILRSQLGMHKVKLAIQGGVLHVEDMPDDVIIEVKEYDNDSEYLVEKDTNGCIIETDIYQTVEDK